MIQPIDTNGPVVKFANRVQAAVNKKSPNINLTLAEAVELSTQLVAMQSIQLQMQTTIIELQKQLLAAPKATTISGGSFK